MSLGAFVFSTALYLYAMSSAKFTRDQQRTDLLSRQRSALAPLLYDVRMAGHFGPALDGQRISLPNLDNHAPDFDCREGYFVDFTTPVHATDGDSLACIDAYDAHLPGTDVLTLRYALGPIADSALRDGEAYLRAWPGGGEVFFGAQPPRLAGENFRLVQHSYFLSPYLLDPHTPLPTLKRLRLYREQGRMRYRVDIMAEGVDQLQLQLGLRDCGGASLCEGAPITHFVTASHADAYDSAMQQVSHIGALRLGLVWRSVEPTAPREISRQFDLPGQSVHYNDRYARNMLVRTVAIRNGV